MAPLSEILRSLYGAYRLACFAPDGLEWLRCTPGGFYRSFTAAAIIAPFFLVLLLVYGNAEPRPPVFGRYLALEVISYVISWCAFPLIMERLCRTMNLRDRYVRFIVAYNWTMVPQNVIYISVAVVGYWAGFSDGTVNGLALIILIWGFIYTGFVARTTLEVEPMVAAGIVILDFLLSLTIEAVVN